MSLKALGKIFFAFKKRFAPGKSFVKNAGLRFVVLIYHHRMWDKILLPFCRWSSGNRGNWMGLSLLIWKLCTSPWLWHIEQARNKMQDNSVFQSHVNIPFNYFFTSPSNIKLPESPMITSYCSVSHTMPSLKQLGREKCIYRTQSKVVSWYSILLCQMTF